MTERRPRLDHPNARIEFEVPCTLAFVQNAACSGDAHPIGAQPSALLDQGSPLVVEEPAPRRPADALVLPVAALDAFISSGVGALSLVRGRRRRGTRQRPS